MAGELRIGKVLDDTAPLFSHLAQAKIIFQSLLERMNGQREQQSRRTASELATLHYRAGKKSFDQPLGQTGHPHWTNRRYKKIGRALQERPEEVSAITLLAR
jgi:hypothetical protein